MTPIKFILIMTFLIMTNESSFESSEIWEEEKETAGS